MTVPSTVFGKRCALVLVRANRTSATSSMHATPQTFASQSRSIGYLTPTQCFPNRSARLLCAAGQRVGTCFRNHLHHNGCGCNVLKATGKFTLLSSSTFSTSTTCKASSSSSVNSKSTSKTTPTTTTTSKSSSNTTNAARISWAEFFAYRKSLKTFELTGLILGSFFGFSAGMFYFMMVADFDPTQQLFGMQDPTLLYFLGVFATAGIAGFLGGQFGGMLRRLTKQRPFLQALDAKEGDFYRRIERYRPKEIAAVVPIPGGQQSGMPDYYGEKVFSVRDYRDWMRKQRKFKISRELKRKGL